jgi:hypothetical protein
MSTEASGEQDVEMTFVVKVHSFGRDDDAQRLRVAGVLWKYLNNGFGADRVQVWSQGERIYFDPTYDELLP